MVFKNLCVHVLCTKVAPSLEGLIEIDTDKPGERSWHELVSALISAFDKGSQQTGTIVSINYNVPSQTLLKM